MWGFGLQWRNMEWRNAVVRLRPCRPAVSQLTSQSRLSMAFLCHPFRKDVPQQSECLAVLSESVLGKHRGCGRQACVCFTSLRSNCVPNMCSYINIPEVCKIQTLWISFTPITQCLLDQRIFQSFLAKGTSGSSEYLYKYQREIVD